MSRLTRRALLGGRRPLNVSVYIIGGGRNGAGNGGGSGLGGGGGGAGQVLHLDLQVPPGVHPIVVGAPGQPSSAFGHTAATGLPASAATGGDSGNGFAGGAAADSGGSGAGGGGATGPGGNATPSSGTTVTPGGNGGPGLAIAILGLSVAQGGHGGDGARGGGFPAPPTAPGSGGNGAGSEYGSGPYGPTSGQPGMVVAIYLTSEGAAAGGVVTTFGDYTIHVISADADFVY